jgi:hypothetical protein
MHEVCGEQAQGTEQNMALIDTCRMKQRAKANKLVTLLYIILNVEVRTTEVPIFLIDYRSV